MKRRLMRSKYYTASKSFNDLRSEIALAGMEVRAFLRRNFDACKGVVLDNVL